ncbi:MAG: NTP transferase domain-containing protein [Sphingomonas sp.]
MTDTRYTALVLAATRGNRDPLAVAGGVSHKAFIDIAGEPMLRRVVRGVIDSGRVGRVIVQIEDASTAEAREVLSPLGADAMIVFTPSAESIGASVAAAVDAFPDSLPLIVTTGDNALHDGELVKFFCDALDDVDDDGALGLTPASYVLEKYPEGNAPSTASATGSSRAATSMRCSRPRRLRRRACSTAGDSSARSPGG